MLRFNIHQVRINIHQVRTCCRELVTAAIGTNGGGDQDRNHRGRATAGRSAWCVLTLPGIAGRY